MIEKNLHVYTLWNSILSKHFIGVVCWLVCKPCGNCEMTGRYLSFRQAPMRHSRLYPEPMTMLSALNE